MARILVVEDEANLRLLYRLELGIEGHEIIEVGSGAEALAVLDQEKIDAAVLDLQLPDVWGLQLVDEMLSRQRDLPIIINTAYSQFRYDFHSWGADAFVVKSSDMSELRYALERVLGESGKKVYRNGGVREAVLV